MSTNHYCMSGVAVRVNNLRRASHTGAIRSIVFRVFACGLLWTLPTFCLHAESDAPAIEELQAHMLRVVEEANAESEVSSFELGTEPLAVALCKSQNLTEKGRFLEAVQVLSALPENQLDSYERNVVTTRIEILEKWAKAGVAEAEDHRRFYLEGYRRSFLDRSHPSASLWQNSRIPEDEKLPLLAQLLYEKNDKLGAALAWMVLSSSPAADEILAARALLAAGNALYEIGDLQGAEKAWIRIGYSAESAPSWTKARFNLGLTEYRRQNYERAIAYFLEVLDSKPDDKEPGSNIMETNRNYSHRSAWQISLCYEAMGDFQGALRYARLAKDHYRFISWCGTCMIGANVAINKRIAYLAARTPQLQLAGVVVLVGGIIGWRRWRRWKRSKAKRQRPAGTPNGGERGSSAAAIRPPEPCVGSLSSLEPPRDSGHSPLFPPR